MFYFLDYLFHCQSFRFSNFVQVHLTVNLLNNKNLYFRFVGRRFHHHILGGFNVIFFDIFGDYVHKRPSKFMYFAHSYSVNLRHFLRSGGIGGGHFFQRRILENNVGGQVSFFGEFFAEGFQQAQQCFVVGNSTVGGVVAVFVFVVFVFVFAKSMLFRHHNRVGVANIISPFFGQRQNTKVFGIFSQIAINHQLPHQRPPIINGFFGLHGRACAING